MFFDGRCPSTGLVLYPLDEDVFVDGILSFRRCNIRLDCALLRLIGNVRCHGCRRICSIIPTGHMFDSHSVHVCILDGR